MRDFSNSKLLEETALPGTPPSLINPRIAAAMTHPTRVYAMKVLFERTASPKEIAAEMGEPVNNVTYHIKRLLEFGCIELTSTRPARGGRVVEHFYRATSRVIFDDDTWNQLGEKQKADVTAGIMRLISEDVSEAMVQGTFYDPDDSHITRSPMVLDPEGWAEVESLLNGTLDKLFAIQERVVARRQQKQEDDRALHTVVHMLHFRTPTPKRPETD